MRIENRAAVREKDNLWIKLTPTKAIKQECRYCMNFQRIRCASEICKLNLNHHKELTPLKRIKAHCIDCIPEQSTRGVTKCDGWVLNPEPHACPLHPYRLGHNPRRKGIGGKNNLETLTHNTVKPLF